MIEKMKVVHIVTTAAEKTALLDRLQQLGIVHFSEKASADQQHLQRFADLSRMVTVLQEYGNVPPEKVPLSNDEFEVFFSELSACMERKKRCRRSRPPLMPPRKGWPSGAASPRRICVPSRTQAGTSTFTARIKRPWPLC